MPPLRGLGGVVFYLICYQYATPTGFGRCLVNGFSIMISSLTGLVLYMFFFHRCVIAAFFGLLQHNDDDD